MLYLAKCRMCNHLLHSSDSHLLKQYMASHMTKSHELDYGIFVADIPLREFEHFLVVTIRNKSEANFLKSLLAQKTFWHYYRNSNRIADARLNSLFSGQLIGEIKPFCNPN